VSIYFCPQQTRHDGAQEHIYRHDSVALSHPLHRNLVHRNSLPKLSNFPWYFTQLGKFRGEANDEKHADPGKKNRNNRNSRENSRNLLEAFLRSRKEENLYGHCDMTARPYESCKIFRGRPRRNAFSKLVHRWYKSCPPDRFCQLEIQNTTGLSNKPSTA